MPDFRNKNTMMVSKYSLRLIIGVIIIAGDSSIKCLAIGNRWQ